MLALAEKDYFRLSEAASYCGVTRERFDRDIRTRVPALSLWGSGPIFRRADLDYWEDFPPGPPIPANRHEAIRQRTPAWADRAAIAEVYKKARRLTAETGVQHHVDHVIPLHGERISGLHVPENLRIVQAKLNLRKSNKWHG